MRFITIEIVQNDYSKCFTLASSTLLHLFFTSDSVVFIGGDARIFLALERRVPGYATDSMYFEINFLIIVKM